MSRNLSSQLFLWLNQLKIPVSKSYLNRQLLSHPDYPSLLSITDTLDELNIGNTAIEIEKDHLGEVPVPFLTHLKTNGGEFVIVEKRDDLDKQFPKFFERWSGAVLLAEKPVTWNHEENNKWFRKEKKARLKVAVFVSLLSTFIFVSAFLTWKWQQAVLLFIGAAGIFISWLIVSKDLGIENRIAEQVCGDDADCDAALKSKGAKLPLGISWSDVGVIWFSFLLLSLLIVSFTKNYFSLYTLLALLATCSLPFTIFSIYYQWRVAKKWCRLCLITVALLWIQFIILIPQLQQTSGWKIDWNISALSGLLLFFISSTWFAIKSLLEKNERIESEIFSNLRFKNDQDIFISLLQKQRRVDTTPFENDLQLGNPGAPLQIMIACNPYCTPCAKAHKILHTLAEKNDVGLTVRFAIKSENKENRKLKATEYLLQLTCERETAYKRKLLYDWYQKMGLEEFMKQHPLLTDIDVENQIRRHEEWSIESGILFTPTIFINGYELPKQYVVQDLKRLINIIKTKETVIAENNYVPA